MKADPAINKEKPADVIKAVLTSWKVKAELIPALVANPTVTLERVARYEYAGRGRRWAAVGSYTKWDVANEFNFK
jgi:hypothetical protein